MVAVDLGCGQPPVPGEIESEYLLHMPFASLLSFLTRELETSGSGVRRSARWSLRAVRLIDKRPTSSRCVVSFLFSAACSTHVQIRRTSPFRSLEGICSGSSAEDARGPRKES